MPPPSSSRPEFRLRADERRVFVALLVGMLVAATSQTMVGPGLPRIVAELGGMDHYAWVATAAMLVSAVAVPIVGKLSDLYGRRAFYIGGLAVFVTGSAISMLAPSFWVLVLGRAVTGLGMGTIMPLSLTVIGDIIPPRFRGRYQAVMGAMFGVASVVGPLAGGVITDHLGWRWMFAATIPFGLAALVAIVRYLHIPHQRREAVIDRAGIALLSSGLVVTLLATSWGGTQYPWGSPTIIGMFLVGALLLAGFVRVELRAVEPIVPLRLFRSSIFTAANLANFAVAMVMFGSIFYIPVFAQGVVGVGATESSLVLMPLMLGMVVLGIVAGQVVTRTGRYKAIIVTGIVLIGAGEWLLTRLDHTATQAQLTVAMVVVGAGIGLSLQQLLLVVQNDAPQRDIGVATATSQFFRNVGRDRGRRRARHGDEQRPARGDRRPPPGRRATHRLRHRHRQRARPRGARDAAARRGRRGASRSGRAAARGLPVGAADHRAGPGVRAGDPCRPAAGPPARRARSSPIPA